jgi:hypothetical protein
MVSEVPGWSRAFTDEQIAISKWQLANEQIATSKWQLAKR